MSAVVGDSASAGSKKYVNFDEYVDFQVDKTRAGIRNTDLLFAAVTVLLVFASYLLAFVIADQWLLEGGFSYWPRVALLGALAGFAGVWTTTKIVLPYWKRVTSLYAARELEQTQPQLKSSLLTLVDLKNAGRPIAPHILSALEKRAALQLSQIDVEQAVDRRPLMRLAYALFGVVVAFCLYTVLSPKPVGASILRALLPIADVGVATRTRILKVDPGDSRILARSQLDVIVDLGGEIPPEVLLLYTTSDGSLVDEPVVLRDTGDGLNRFAGTLSGPNGRGLLQDFTYRITAGDAASETYHVNVRQAPYATVESVTYTYPPYRGLDPRTQTGGEIDAWEGTQVTLHAVANMAVSGATLRLHDSENTKLRGIERKLKLVDETHIEGTWTLEFNRDGTAPRFYSIDLVTSEGQHDPDPQLHNLNIRRDLPPEIKLLHPSGDVELPINAVLPISFIARDPDFMLQSVRMHFEKRDTPLPAKTRHLYDAPPARSELQGQSEIDLNQFQDQLNPGDVLTFWLEAIDNRPPMGTTAGNITVTPKINITISDPAGKQEIEKRREEEAAAARQKLEEAQSQQSAAEQNPGEQGEADSTDENSAPPDNAESADATTQPADDRQSRPPEKRGDQNSRPDQQAGDTGAQNKAGDDQGDSNPKPADQQPQGQKAPKQSDEPQDGAGDAQSDKPQPGQEQDGHQSDPNSQPPSQPTKNGQPNSRPSGESRPQQQTGKQQRGHQASDDEALAKFVEKYKDDIQRQREQEQKSNEENDQNGDPKPGGDQAGDDRQPPQNSQNSSDDDTASDRNSPNDDSRSDSSTARKPRDQRKPDDRRQQPSAGGDDKSGNGDNRNTDQQNGRPDAARTPQKPANQDDRKDGGSQGEQPQSDPRANQDPRVEEQDSGPRGEQEPGQPDADQANARDSSTPMPGENAANEQNDPSQPKPDENSSNASSSPSDSSAGNSAEKKPAGEESSGGGKPGKPDTTGINNPNPSSDKFGVGTNEQEAPKQDAAQSGDQPAGADNPNPGEGKKDGQRSAQPSTGENGSSQQTSEGQPGGDQKGAGEPSQTPGSKNETGKSGQSQPGQGKPAGQKPGQSQPGGSPSGDSGSQPSSSGGDESSSGDPSQSSGDQKSSGDSKPGGKSADSKSKDGKGGKPTDSDATNEPGQQSGKQDGEAGNGGDEKAAGDKPQGDQPGSGDSNSDGEQSDEQGAGGGKDGKQAGDQKGSDQQGGGKPGGDKPQGAGKGESGGKGEGGGKGEQSEGGGSSGDGESGESGSGSSSQPGKGSSSGEVKQGQPGSGRSGGRGVEGAAAPTGGGGDGGPNAGPADAPNLEDKKRATELVLRRLEDELSRGDVSPELLRELGWSEEHLRDFMARLDRRLSDSGEDQSPEAQARRRQFTEILRGIDYSSEGRQQSSGAGDRPIEAGSAAAPRKPAPAEFRDIERSLNQKKSRETKSK